MAKTYELTQRLVSVATHYDICESGKDAVVMYVKVELMSAKPIATLYDEASGESLGSLRRNFNKTHYEVVDAKGKSLAVVDFPMIAFKKTMKLTTAGKEYNADAGVLRNLWEFDCKDAEGHTALTVKKPEGPTKLRDHFIVEPSETVPKEVALLVTVAIHARYFEFI